MKDKVIKVRLTGQLYEGVKDISARRGQSATELIRQLIADGIRKMEVAR
jgi:predicted DNA-binding protein